MLLLALSGPMFWFLVVEKTPLVHIQVAECPSNESETKWRSLHIQMKADSETTDAVIR